MISVRGFSAFAVDHPRQVTAAAFIITVMLACLAGLPSLWPDTFSMLNSITVDTDPENMLPEDEPVRVFHDQMKERMSLYDMIVVGVTNEQHPEGVFNPSSLKNIHTLTQYARSLQWPDTDSRDKKIGVVEPEIIAPSMVDNIEQDTPGSVRFEWLMKSPPDTQAAAETVRRKAADIPLFNGTMVSEDGKALAIYLPITSKDLSYKISRLLQKKIESFSGNEKYYITGLPVAEDTFGVQMFIQMGISAPLAMLIIFIVMILFFRKAVLIISPLIIAVMATVWVMSLLIITGKTIHIMSSMIPIFVMPIAVLDSVHILSEFFDRYRESGDRKKTIIKVMDDLFMPMLYTSMTTAVGFASLALAPIPPVQVFGIYVAFGVLAAWLLTITFIPSYIMFIPERRLTGFGKKDENKSESRFVLLDAVAGVTFKNARLVLTVSMLVVAVSAYGISLITINDNPTKWFTRDHPIRIADRVLNSHFGGTYMAYLSLEADQVTQDMKSFFSEFSFRADNAARSLSGLVAEAETVFERIKDRGKEIAGQYKNPEKYVAALSSFAQERKRKAQGEKRYAWDEVILFLDGERQRFQIFKDPEVLEYIDRLQRRLNESKDVGKVNTLSDIVKTVYRELLSGEEKDFTIPETSEAVGQCLITYQNSHRPQDVWHFVTPDYKKSVLWVQLTSGDNKDMSRVVESVRGFISDNPPPLPLRHRWFGLTYINVVWQDKMVRGMLNAFLGSFLIVFLMMTLLYRSGLWGLLSMIPLLVTIVLIYGIIGFAGKDYDMPVAVLSSLSLGLAVDYAIHFLSRSRAMYAEKGSWGRSIGPMFGDPARAISRNVIVLGVGFVPLLFAPLVPYKTVGFFIAAILITAGIATLFMLPSLITLFQRLLFPVSRAMRITCRCGTCIISSITLIAAVIVNAVQFITSGWTRLTVVGLTAIVLLSLGCFVMSRRYGCAVQDSE